MTYPLHRFTQRGLTLIEAILAVLILASSIIGIAAIYAGQEKAARGGRLHSDAVTLAQQMAQIIATHDDPRDEFETTLGSTCSKDAPPANNSQRVACWQETVSQQLTNGSSYISIDRNTTPNEYVIVVSWSEPRTGTASYVLRVTKPERATDSGSR